MNPLKDKHKIILFFLNYFHNNNVSIMFEELDY